MQKITFLGPLNATFSHDAYNLLAEIYGAPKEISEGPEANCVPASSNGEILKLIGEHGGYGAIAMETRAEGRVAEPLESFIDLLNKYPKTEACPFHIVGAVKMKLHFCFMMRRGMSTTPPHGIIAHPKSLGACRERVRALGIPTQNAPSNGEAARLVAESQEHALFAALGPRSAADKYGLEIINLAFEDKEAVTTFFLIAPKSHKIRVGEENRMLIVYELLHRSGTLVHSLLPFAQNGINLVQIHSVHAGNGVYNFAIEVESLKEDREWLRSAMEEFHHCTLKYLPFGPFEVL